jgi:hypothetical protein
MNTLVSHVVSSLPYIEMMPSSPKQLHLLVNYGENILLEECTQLKIPTLKIILARMEDEINSL